MASTSRNPAGALPLVSVVIPTYSVAAPEAIDRVESLRVNARCVQLKALHCFYRCDRWLIQKLRIVLAQRRSQLPQAQSIEPPIKPLPSYGTCRGKPPDPQQSPDSNL